MYNKEENSIRRFQEMLAEGLATDMPVALARAAVGLPEEPTLQEGLRRNSIKNLTRGKR